MINIRYFVVGISMELFFKISLFIEVKSIRKYTYKNNLISLLDETIVQEKNCDIVSQIILCE